MKQILQSLAITMVISLSISTCVWYLLNYNFYKWLVGVTVLQFVTFAVMNNLKEYYQKIVFERETTARIKEFTKQGVTVSCTYCGSNNFVPIRMDQDNDFTCDNCGKTNGVYVNITAAQKTQMIENSKLNVSTLIAEKFKDDPEINEDS